MLPRLAWSIKEIPYGPARAEWAGRASRSNLHSRPGRRESCNFWMVLLRRRTFLFCKVSRTELKDTHLYNSLAIALMIFLREAARWYRKDWVVYAKRPFGGATQVFRYLGRYSHRVAISNGRLVSMDA